MLTKLCCMRLNTAGVVIGWIGVVGSFLTLIVLGLCLGNAHDIAEAIVKNWDSPEISAAQITTYLVVVLSVYAALTVINLLASGMLIIGTYKERHLWLLPWLINSATVIVFGILYNLAVWILLFSKGITFDRVLPSILGYSITLALNLYIFFGIYSLFKHIQASREEQRPLIPDNEHVPQQTATYPNYTTI